MKFSYKIHESGSDILLAICDESVLGKTFESDNHNITIDPNFYHEKFSDEKTILQKIKEATIVNAIGKETIKILINNKLTKKEEVIEICGLPHTMIVVV
ncbi:MAG: DUF424 family protein [Candidatus Aenigmatarchaeota archaeon]